MTTAVCVAKLITEKRTCDRASELSMSGASIFVWMHLLRKFHTWKCKMKALHVQSIKVTRLLARCPALEQGAVQRTRPAARPRPQGTSQRNVTEQILQHWLPNFNEQQLKKLQWDYDVSRQCVRPSRSSTRFSPDCHFNRTSGMLHSDHTETGTLPATCI